MTDRDGGKSKGIIYICPSFYLVGKWSSAEYSINNKNFCTHHNPSQLVQACCFECRNDQTEYQECIREFLCCMYLPVTICTEYFPTVSYAKSSK